jgi:hypothetical protein
MTREEQVNKAVEDLLNEAEIDILDRPLLRMWYKLGVNFADKNPIDRTDWQQVRIQASIAAMQGIISNETRHKEAKDSWAEDWSFLEAIAKDACLYADNLVEELKLCKV